MVGIFPSLRQGAVVPDVAVAGEGVGHVPKPSALLVVVLEFNFRGSLTREKDTTLGTARIICSSVVFHNSFPVKEKTENELLAVYVS